MGYDILVPREVRLDAFLFGEEQGRYLVALSEAKDDEFLLKMDDARLNCCFLGRTTKNRVVVDGFDFGPVSQYIG
jgi:phosphoribosylformylglycinamidine synthase